MGNKVLGTSVYRIASYNKLTYIDIGIDIDEMCSKISVIVKYINPLSKRLNY